MIQAIIDFITKILGSLWAPKKPVRIKDLEMIKAHEGLRLGAYMPTKNDVWTIGYGHTHTAKAGQRITEEYAEFLLRQDILWVEAVLNSLVEVPLSQNQYDALGSFIYNVGGTAFANSTLLRVLNGGDYSSAADQLLRWDKQKGKVLQGLSVRRAKERALFLRE
jgi:lysozyme